MKRKKLVEEKNPFGCGHGAGIDYVCDKCKTHQSASDRVETGQGEPVRERKCKHEWLPYQWKDCEIIYDDHCDYVDYVYAPDMKTVWQVYCKFCLEVNSIEHEKE